MAKWTLPDKLQPSLLDRLTDRQPDRTKESPAQRVLSQQQIKEAVIRDIGWLLNTVSLDTVYDLSAFPEARRSVINYGLPDISGRTASSIDVDKLEKELQRVIYEFEPRVIPNSLKIKIHSQPDEMNHNSLVFEIQGVVFGQPMPFQVMLQSELDLESGDFVVRENLR